VEHAARVAVFQGGDELPEVKPGSVLLEAPLSPHLVEEFAAGCKLHDEVDFRLGREDFEEVNDVGVVQAAHDRDLAFDVGSKTSVYDLAFADGLHRHALAGFDAGGVVDLGERANSE